MRRFSRIHVAVCWTYGYTWISPHWCRYEYVSFVISWVTSIWAPWYWTRWAAAANFIFAKYYVHIRFWITGSVWISSHHDWLRLRQNPKVIKNQYRLFQMKSGVYRWPLRSCLFELLIHELTDCSTPVARTRGIDSNQWLIPPERTISAPQTATATTLSEAPPPAESLTDNINIAPHLDTIQVCEEDRQTER